MSDNEELAQLKQTVKTLAQALIERTELDDQRAQNTTMQLQQFGQLLSQMREEAAIGDVPPKTAQYVGNQIAGMFSNPVVLDSISSAILGRLQGALQERATKSKDRQPQLLISEQFVPGSRRVILTEEGDLTIELPPEEMTDVNGGWIRDEQFMGSQELIDLVKQLMASYGVDANRYYFMIDDISLQNHREDVSRQLMERDERLQREEAIRRADQGQTEEGLEEAPQELPDFPEPEIELSSSPEVQEATDKALSALEELKADLTKLN